ncbi:MAG: hypothetical protein SGARI_001245, partial [Bacillariaceae sp.]
MKPEKDLLDKYFEEQVPEDFGAMNLDDDDDGGVMANAVQHQERAREQLRMPEPNAPLFPVWMRRPMDVGHILVGNVPIGPGFLGEPSSFVRRNDDGVVMRGKDKKERRPRRCVICRQRNITDAVAAACPGNSN